MITVVLVRPQSPENLGFIARAMANFDLKVLMIFDPLCDPFDMGAIKTSKHSHNILKNARIRPYEDLKEISKEFDLVAGTTSVLGSDYNIPRTPVSSREFSKIADSRNIALVFGNEGTGLVNEEINICDIIITIPSSKDYPALNISHAASIIFYDLYQANGSNKLNKDIAPASAKNKEIIEGLMEEILENIEFSTSEKRETQKIAWKRIFSQSMMSRREAFAVIGLLKKLKERLSKRS